MAEVENFERSGLMTVGPSSEKDTDFLLEVQPGTVLSDVAIVVLLDEQRKMLQVSEDELLLQLLDDVCEP